MKKIWIKKCFYLFVKIVIYVLRHLFVKQVNVSQIQNF